jgi:hypothetical protein
MCNVYPVKYYKDEGFVEHKIEIDGEDLEEIIEGYLMRHAEFDFDEIEIVDSHPMNIWLYAKCRKYIDPDAPEEEHIADAEIEVPGKCPALFDARKRLVINRGIADKEVILESSLL